MRILLARVLLCVAAALVLAVAWNIVAPPDWCWLGFWKGAGTALLAFVCLVLYVAADDYSEEDRP